MALDRFIASVRSEVAKRFDLKSDAEIDAFFIGMEESAKDNQEALEKRDKMLRDTVAELCEAKRLLKLAVVNIHSRDYCNGCIYESAEGKEQYLNCEYHKCFKWRYADEALKLLGETGDTNG